MTCKEVKALDAFGSVKRNWDGLHKYCKPCWAKRIANQRKANPHQKLSEEELKESYKSRAKAISEGVKKKYEESPDYRENNRIMKQKPIVGINLLTGEELYFSSGLEANKKGFNNTNIWKAIKDNKPYKGYRWQYLK